MIVFRPGWLFKYGVVLLFTLLAAHALHARKAAALYAENNILSPWVIKAGYVYQQSSYFETGVIYAKHALFMGDAFGFTGVYAGAEARIGGSHSIFGAKIGLESHLAFLGGRATFTYHTDFDRGAWQFSPEAGLSFGGRVYVFAGYNWTFTHKDFWNTTGFKVSLGVNFIRR